MKRILLLITCILTVFLAVEGSGKEHMDTAAANFLRPPGMAEKLGYHEGDSTILIPAWVRELPAYCFAGCKGLRSVRFESDSRLGKISEYAFTECEDLEEFDMPRGVLYISEGAFRGCRKLRTIELPERIQRITRETFAYCRDLNGIKLPAGIREIGALAFIDCRSLELSEIPRGVAKIGNNAFCRCFSIREMKLPATCKDLGSYAFADCTSLTSVELPANEAMLGELIFSGCNKLRLIREGSLVPPIIECNSTLFEPSDKAAWRECVVIVPPGRLQSYKDSPFWNTFKKLKDDKD